ncbi:hypothetical protein L1887_54424 [Cichorium endivia]|nr:hypothetical protein L1887_54424 [Cichorium endivia]
MKSTGIDGDLTLRLDQELLIVPGMCKSTLAFPVCALYAVGDETLPKYPEKLTLHRYIELDVIASVFDPDSRRLQNHHNAFSGRIESTISHRTNTDNLSLGAPSQRYARSSRPSTANPTESLDTRAVTPAEVCTDGVLVNLIAYEFPFCLSGKGLLENLFLSRPTDTKLAAKNTSGSSTYESECVEVKATKGRGAFHTSIRLTAAMRDLVSWWRSIRRDARERRRRIPLSTGFSRCFTKASKFVLPIVSSAKIQCSSLTGYAMRLKVGCKATIRLKSSSIPLANIHVLGCLRVAGGVDAAAVVPTCGAVEAVDTVRARLLEQLREAFAGVGAVRTFEDHLVDGGGRAGIQCAGCGVAFVAERGEHGGILIAGVGAVGAKEESVVLRVLCESHFVAYLCIRPEAK